MKKSLVLVLFALLASIGSVYATYIEKLPVSVTQPDGVELNLFASGDEYYNWMHDADNYTIIKDQATGYYVYAVNDKKGNIVPSSFVVGQVNPQTTDLTVGTQLSSKLIEKQTEGLRKFNQTNDLKRTMATSSVIFPGSYLNQLVVFIEFSDGDGFTTSMETYNNRFNGDTINSVKNFFLEMSGGAMNVSTYFYPQTSGTYPLSYVDSHPKSYYEKNSEDGYGDDFQERRRREILLLKNASEFIASQVPASIDLDANNDGKIDNVVFVVNAQSQGWSELLWPHKTSFPYDEIVNINGVKVDTYNFLTKNGVGVGIVSHELFHSFGAPDLYKRGSGTINSVYKWDLMGFQDWKIPQHTSVYYKKKFGDWGPEISTISADGVYTLEPISTNPFAAYKIPLPNSTTEFLMVEYRKKEGLYDVSLPGEGLVIYKVNTTSNGSYGNVSRDEIYFYRPGGTHAADGDFNNVPFSSTYGRTEFDDFTNPALLLSDGTTGGFTNGFGISEISEIGSTISFKFTAPPPSIPNFCLAPTWSATSTYNQDDIVSFDNHQWKAKWWTQNNTPGIEFGPWEEVDECVVPSNTPTVEIKQPLGGGTFLVTSPTVGIIVDVNNYETTIDSVRYVVVDLLCNVGGCASVNCYTETEAPFTLALMPTFGTIYTEIHAIAFHNGIASEESVVTTNFVAEPTISITSPINGEEYEVPVGDSTVDITVDVNYEEARVDSVTYTVVNILCNVGGCASVTSYTETESPFTLTIEPALDIVYTEIIASVYSNGIVASSDQVQTRFVQLVPQDIVLISPKSNNVLGVNNTYSFSVELSDSIGIVNSVTYKVEGPYTVEQTVTSSPFTLDWGFTQTGVFVATVVAVTAEGDTITSESISLSVVESNPTAVITSPVNNSAFVIGDMIHFTIDAVDLDGTIDSVEWYFPQGGTFPVMITTSTAPFDVTWTADLVRDQLVYAIAYDNDGRVAHSVAIALSITDSDCTTNPSWDAATVYNTGDRVVVGDVLYEAKWWTLNNDPLTNSGEFGVWSNLGECGSSSTQSAGVSNSVATVSPNLVVDNVTISANGTVVIYNMFGDKILETVVEGEKEVEVSGWEAGIYVLRVNNTEMIRFIKE